MSRYPSYGIERFDQQFAETEGERNERLRRKRSAQMSDLDRLHSKENEIARLMTENIRFRTALQRIAEIKNEDFGSDWQEIEAARKIANCALGL